MIKDSYEVHSALSFMTVTSVLVRRKPSNISLGTQFVDTTVTYSCSKLYPLNYIDVDFETF